MKSGVTTIRAILILTFVICTYKVMAYHIQNPELTNMQILQMFWEYHLAAFIAAVGYLATLKDR